MVIILRAIHVASSNKSALSNCRLLQLSCNCGFFTHVKFSGHGGIGISSFFCIILNLWYHDESHYLDSKIQPFAIKSRPLYLFENIVIYRIYISWEWSKNRSEFNFCKIWYAEDIFYFIYFQRIKHSLNVSVVCWFVIYQQVTTSFSKLNNLDIIYISQLWGNLWYFMISQVLEGSVSTDYLISKDYNGWVAYK